MFSRPDSDLIRLDSGHPHVFGALVFEGDALRYLEAVWMEGVGLPDQVDEASLERLMISARAHGYVLSVKERLPLRSSGGMRRERMYLAIENPDPLRDGAPAARVRADGHLHPRQGHRRGGPLARRLARGGRGALPEREGHGRGSRARAARG